MEMIVPHFGHKPFIREQGTISSPHAGRGDYTREWIPGDKDYGAIEGCLPDPEFLNENILRKEY